MFASASHQFAIEISAYIDQLVGCPAACGKKRTLLLGGDEAGIEVWWDGVVGAQRRDGARDDGQSDESREQHRGAILLLLFLLEVSRHHIMSSVSAYLPAVLKTSKS